MPRGGKQTPFTEVIRADKAGVAAVFIGINDVWWCNISPEDLGQAVRDLAKAARGNGTALALDTLSVYQEQSDGGNPKDARI